MKSPATTRLLAAGILFLTLGLAAAQPARDPETAQPALPTIHLSVHGKTIVAEVADEPHEQMAGLMFRDQLADNAGMLFILHPPRRASFWMKNTSLPLSVAYISTSGKILEIHDLEPGNETPVASAFPRIAYALEMNRDWFRHAGVLPGEHITGLPRPAAP